MGISDIWQFTPLQVKFKILPSKVENHSASLSIMLSNAKKINK